MMSTDDVVRARIDGKVKEQATRVLSEMGLSVSDAIRMLLVRVAREKALPFDVRVPNEETIAAIEKLRRGEGHKANSIDELMAKLNADN
jgi:DNA-damage-inducible protein J